MTTSDWSKTVKQLKDKPAVMNKHMKHCKPKTRKCGVTRFRCENCGRYGAKVGQYRLNLCRQCFREVARDLGFEKYK